MRGATDPHLLLGLGGTSAQYSEGPARTSRKMEHAPPRQRVPLLQSRL